MKVWLVTDPRWSEERIVSVVRQAGAALGNAFAVQVRDRASPPRSLAERLRTITRETGSRLYVNRWIDLAREIEADGLHGAPWEGPFTMPAHDDAELAHAVTLGAEAVLVSPIFETPGKGPPKGVSYLGHARAFVSDLVVVALGGITTENAAACRAAGADAVAVMRSLLDAADPADTALLLAGGVAR